LDPMVRNLRHIIGIEALCAAQGIEARAPLMTSAKLQQLIGMIRTDIPPLIQDRFMAHDIVAAAQLVVAGPLSNAAGLTLEQAQ